MVEKVLMLKLLEKLFEALIDLRQFTRFNSKLFIYKSVLKSSFGH